MAFLLQKLTKGGGQRGLGAERLPGQPDKAAARALKTAAAADGSDEIPSTKGVL